MLQTPKLQNGDIHCGAYHELKSLLLSRPTFHDRTRNAYVYHYSVWSGMMRRKQLNACSQA